MSENHPFYNCNFILSQCNSMPLCIGIDGMGGSGKSTFSEQLAQAFQKQHIPVSIFHLDDFIHPRSVRYDTRFSEWENYYYRQWRYDDFIKTVLLPFRNGIETPQSISLYDKETDTYYTQTVVLPVHGVLIAEGVFLQRAPLKNQFDKIIYLSVPESVRLNRVLQRDTYIGTAQQIIEKYENRYFPAERHYLAKHHPEQTADFLIQD